MALGLVIVCLVWGSTWLAIKIGLDAVPPLLGASMRFICAAILLFVIMRFRRTTIPSAREFWKLGRTLALNTFGIPFALVYWGQQQIPSSLASILFATFPFCVALISHFRLPEEHITLSKGLGIVFGFLGIYVIFASEFALESELAILGMGAVVLCALLQAFALVTLRKHGRGFDPFALNFVGMAGGAALLLVASLLFEDYLSLQVNAAAVGSLLYLSVFGSVVTFVVYFWLVKHVQAVLLSLTAFVTPILAVILGAMVLDERLAPEIVAGSVLVLAGILLANAAEVWKSVKRGRALLLD